MKINKIKEEESRKNTPKLSFISWFGSNDDVFNLSEEKKKKFVFSPNNHEIAAIIIKKINIYMNEIKALFPERSEIIKSKKDFERLA